MERARRAILQRLRAARDPLAALALASEVGDARPSEIRSALDLLLAQGAILQGTAGFVLSEAAREPQRFDVLLRGEARAVGVPREGG